MWKIQVECKENKNKLTCEPTTLNNFSIFPQVFVPDPISGLKIIITLYI